MNKAIILIMILSGDLIDACWDEYECVEMNDAMYYGTTMKYWKRTKS